MSGGATCVLITTHNRPDLLEGRSLLSVASQSYKPALVVLVDDSDLKYRSDNKKILGNVFGLDVKTMYMENNGTKGMAGALNTGLMWIESNTNIQWVAILDDDDEWLPNHLETCNSPDLDRYDAVVSGLELVIDGTPLPQDYRDSFTISDFLRGNPGWQGSNTFVRISTLAEADYFDEALASTHDRDLAIRLLCLEDFRLLILQGTTARFFLDRGRESVTNSKKKRLGLTQFWKKHIGRMNSSDRAVFRERAKNLFGVSGSHFR